MTRWMATLTCAVAASLSLGAMAAAEPARAAADTTRLEQSSGEKRLQRRHHRRDYRGRDYRGRDYRDRRHVHRHGYRDRHRDRRYDHHYHAAQRCWRERRHDYYRGRPAVVSLRICRDRYGRHYVDHRSRQLIYYVSRHQRRW